jgi:hypothetical protein
MTLNDESATALPPSVQKSKYLSARLCAIAKRSFFLHLGKWLFQSQQTSPNAEYIEKLMKGLFNLLENILKILHL